MVYPAEETHGTANDGIITVSLSGNHPNFVFPGKPDGKAPWPWFTDAVSKADPYIDFSKYDADADGHLSTKEFQVMFLVAGGESAAGFIPGIWGQAGCFWTEETYDGYHIGECAYQGYSAFGERQGNYDATIGVIAHELGHAIFCYPDLYDPLGNSAGIGAFGLMSGGAWGNKQGEYGGATPVHLMAWSKYKSDGSLCYKDILSIDGTENTANFNGVVFELPDNISSNTSSVTLYHTTHTNFNTKIINISGKTKEYFMLENIGHDGYQAGLDYLLGGNDNTSGIAIWHIDDNQSNNGADVNHKLVDLEEAAEAGMDNFSHSGKQTNLFFSGNKTEFSDSTDPNSKTYSGTSSGITIDNISAAGDSMTFDITF
jgi:M6 family metalloprotease-like protein